jgi:hypothetical protein
MKIPEQRGNRGVVTGTRVDQQRDEITFVDHDRFTRGTIALSAHGLTDLSRPSPRQPSVSPVPYHDSHKCCVSSAVRGDALPPCRHTSQENNICARQ